MLTRIEIINPRVPTLLLPLSNLGVEPIQIRNVEGLGPVKASVNTQPFGSVDGESYVGSNVGKRNIVPDSRTQSELGRSIDE